jgi:branched-chain amino acid transport system permease protein
VIPSKRRAVLGLLCLLGLVVLPLVFGAGALTSLMEQMFAFAAFAMSYDLLLGYTGVVSFGHAMFFGTGAYAVAIFLERGDGSSQSLLYGLASAVILAMVLALLVAFMSLRVRDAYFAMITLAVGEIFSQLAGSQALRHLTNANDGMTVSLPGWLSSDLRIYYLCLGFAVVSLWFLVRVVNSPVGDILRAIRENEARVFGLGHSVIRFKTMAFVISGVIASLSGGMFAISQSFVSTSVYAVSGVSLTVLLMVIIGGVGTLYGGVFGAAIIILFQYFMTNLGSQYPIFQNYPILFGILYIVVVRFMPKGLVGGITSWGGRMLWKKSQPLHK